MENTEITLGQPAILDIFLENTDTEGWYPFIDDPNCDFIIHLMDKDGTLVPWTRFGEECQDRNRFRSWNNVPHITVDAKQAACFRIRLDELFDLTREGKYSATVEFEFKDFESDFHDLFIYAGLTPKHRVLQAEILHSNPFSFLVTDPPSIVPSYAPISSESNKPTTQPG